MPEPTSSGGHVPWGCPSGEYDVPEYVNALVCGLLSELSRVYWNRTQTRYELGHATGVPGLDVRSYWCGDEESSEASLPNLAFGNVEIRWYKYPGRGMSCNREMTPAQWVTWFDACMLAIRATEPNHRT